MVDMIEGHPIPQDITGFQFRLIGDMTVKQFAYLAAGLVLGWICFQFPIPFFLKLVLAAIFVLTGVSFAFVPFQGSSLDTLVFLFFKALIKPNQYVYSKTGKDFKTSETTQSIHTTTPITSQDKAKLLQTNLQTQHAAPATLQPASLTPPPVPAGVIFKDPEQNQFQKQVQDVPMQKQSLEQQLPPIQTTQQLAPIPPSQQAPSPPLAPPTQSHIKKMPDLVKKSATVPFMPDAPNLIGGVIKDARGNVLPNILVEVKDRDDNPVRAFKTNTLGQFASATSLVNGTYTVTFEDPKKQQRFDVIELSATGDSIPPLEITSIDEREDLRKSLFDTS